MHLREIISRRFFVHVSINLSRRWPRRALPPLPFTIGSKLQCRSKNTSTSAQEELQAAEEGSNLSEKMPKPKSGSGTTAAADGSAPTSLAITGGESDAGSTATADVLSGFSDTIVALRSSPPPTAQAAPRNEDNIADVIGNLKIMHNAVASLQTSPTLKSMKLASDMAALALTYLPEDTREALRKSECGSDVAMELVARNLTQLPALAKKLYKVGCTGKDAPPPPAVFGFVR